MTAPLISCILPTYNRRPFIAHAIAYFQRQSYDNRELIILDDGDDRDRGSRSAGRKPSATSDCPTGSRSAPSSTSPARWRRATSLLISTMTIGMRNGAFPIRPRRCRRLGPTSAASTSCSITTCATVGPMNIAIPGSSGSGCSAASSSTARISGARIASPTSTSARTACFAGAPPPARSWPSIGAISPCT